MEPQAISLGDLKQIVRRRIWSLILPLVLFSATGVVLALALPAVYKSTSLILIEEQEIPSDFVMTTVTSFAEQRIQAIKQRVMGFTRLMEIIQKFGLYSEMRGKKPDEEIVEKMREDIALDPVIEKIIDRRTGAKKEANIAFTLSYQGGNPAVVQQITNVLTSLYLEENLKVRVKQVEQTAEFLEGEIAKLKRELEEIEKALAVFKQRHQNALPSMMPMNQQMVFESERRIEMLTEQMRSLKDRETNTLAKYNDLMGKLMEAKVATGLEKEQKGERFTLIEPPRLPTKPFKPNRLAIMAIGVVLGIGAGVGFAALREFSDDAVHSADQLESATRFPVLAGIPEIITPADVRRKKVKKLVFALSTVGVVAVGVLVLHFFVMDIDVFWAKLARRIPL